MVGAQPIRIALVGMGKIARAQHLRTIMASTHFELAATVSLPEDETVGDIPAYTRIADALAGPHNIQAVAICTPPRHRFRIAQEALAAGCHVLLEKPPAAGIAELQALEEQARSREVALFAGWHSRYATCVEPAKAWLADKAISSVSVEWKENVRRWHPGQDWIFEAGGMGVFDPAINALSIVTYILPKSFSFESGVLEIPKNRQAPVSASLNFTYQDEVTIAFDLDFLHKGEDVWNIEVVTADGQMILMRRGGVLYIEGREHIASSPSEYECVYDRFLHLIRTRELDVDATPLIHVADIFMMAERQQGTPFEW